MTTIAFDLIPDPTNRRPTLDAINADINRLRMSQADPKCSFDAKLTVEVPKPPYLQLPDPIDVNGNLLVTSKDLVDMQKRATELAAKRKYESSWQGLTIRRAVADAREAMLGIPADLFGNSEPLPLGTLLTKGDRLRGVGILLAVAAALLMLANATA
jgi:hypothetical protein